MPCYITSTGFYLPGRAVENDDIERYLGSFPDEAEIKKTVLAMNGIVSRHYAQDEHQQPTEDVYAMAAKAVESCLESADAGVPITFLSAGTTFAPLAGPGLASIIHPKVAHLSRLNRPVEISSHSGICTSAAAAFVSAARAINCGFNREFE
ncbi:MAG: hypothetical protein SGI77_05105 [Pirellulaceae bacterium]|nr:hypothetical protein [Pirellulaceae bacterium]